jgi:hypothetical protein
MFLCPAPRTSSRLPILFCHGPVFAATSPGKGVGSGRPGARVATAGRLDRSAPFGWQDVTFFGRRLTNRTGNRWPAFTVAKNSRPL